MIHAGNDFHNLGEMEKLIHQARSLSGRKPVAATSFSD